MKKIASVLLYSLLLTLAATAFADDLLDPNKDTYTRNGHNSSHGDEDTIFLKKTNNGNSIYTRKGIVQFEFNPTYVIDDTALYMDVTTFDRNSSSAATSVTYAIWGLTDGSSLEDFDESSATYNDFTAVLDGSLDGVKNNSTHLFDADLGVSGKQRLGNITVSVNDIDTTLEFKSQGLTEFLRADTDGVVTLIIVDETNDGDVMTGIASRESTTHNAVRLFVETSDETVTAVDDTYCKKGNKSAVFGANTTINVKRANGGSGDNTRKGVIEFNLHDATTVKDAELMLHVVSANETVTINVFGIDDSSDLEDFDDDSDNYNSFTDIFDSSSDGMDNGSSQVYNDGDKLGTFTVSPSDEGDVLTFTSDDMINFINDDSDGVITFVLTSANNNSSVISFASSENTSYNPPQLWMDHTLQKEVSSMDMDLTFIDVDGDNTQDLVLMVNNPEGGGYATAEPWIIADYMNQIGYGLGADDDFFNSLSPTQQDALVDVYETMLGTTVTGSIDGSDLESVMDTLPDYREYEMTSFSSKVTFEAEVTSNSITLYIGIETGTLISYATGDLSVDVSGPSGQAGIILSDDGVAFGAEASLLTVTIAYGDEDGTNIGLSYSAGEGIWVEAKWGQNNQYGGSVPVPGTPFQVTLYIEGDDAVAAWNDVKDWTTGAYGDTKDWIENAWDDSLNFGEGTVVVLDDAYSDTKLFIKNTGEEAYVWCSEAGEESFATLSGGATDVKNGLKDLAGDIVGGYNSTTSTISDTFNSWVSSAGNLVENAWNDVSGWVSGAASSVNNAVKKILDWF